MLLTSSCVRRDGIISYFEKKIDKKNEKFADFINVMLNLDVPSDFYSAHSFIKGGMEIYHLGDPFFKKMFFEKLPPEIGYVEAFLKDEDIISVTVYRKDKNLVIFTFRKFSSTFRSIHLVYFNTINLKDDSYFGKLLNNYNSGSKDWAYMLNENWFVLDVDPDNNFLNSLMKPT